jgi:hypothetical protein
MHPFLLAHNLLRYDGISVVHGRKQTPCMLSARLKRIFFSMSFIFILIENLLFGKMPSLITAQQMQDPNYSNF